MYEDQAERLDGYAQRVKELRQCLNVDGLQDATAQLERQMAQPGFWDDTEAAQKVVKKVNQHKSLIKGPEELRQQVEDVQTLLDMGREEEDESLGSELDAMLAALETKLDKLELTSLLADPRDQKNVILSIHPGAGGTESCDWADMLYRMLLRYCERRDFDVEVVDYQPGDEAGLKSATLTISGPFAYGYLRSEAGVHRLVRISPFDANSRRHTSFAAVEVLTELDEDIDIEVRDEELKMDVFRSSGAGGQKVNKTSSAVRLTHLPTGIVVACQVERSQHRNRATALQFLKAKLYDIELKKKEEELASQREGHQDVAWGSQIRSYVLHPYQMVKDHRTNIETGNVDRVLDGDLEELVEAYLKWDLERKSVSTKT